MTNLIVANELSQYERAADPGFRIRILGRRPGSKYYDDLGSHALPEGMLFIAIISQAPEAIHSFFWDRLWQIQQDDKAKQE